MRRFIGAMAILAALAASAPAVAAGTLRTMSVTGLGKVAAVPDMAVVTLGVEEQGKTAKAATDAMSAAARAILDTVKTEGVGDRDVQTSGLSLFPVYSRGSTPGAEQVLTGFRASTTLTVRARNLDGLGGLLDRLVGAGANRVQGISFDVSTREALMDEARKRAVADALRKAKLYADAAGLQLGNILSLRESTAGAEPRPIMRTATLAAEAVPIAAGESELQSVIQLKIAIHGDK